MCDLQEVTKNAAGAADGSNSQITCRNWFPSIPGNSHERHREMSTRVLELFDKIFRAQFATEWYRQRESLQEGDLVLEIEPTPKRTWRLGLVLHTYPGEARWPSEESKNKNCIVSL